MSFDATQQPPSTDPHPDVPATCPVAFKEWAGVCAALQGGRQSLILRKGGVEEVGGEFRPEHRAFWLYPTVVHQADQGLRTSGEVPSFDPAVVPIEALAVVEWTGRVDRLDQLAALGSWHDWTDETIRGRFAYRRPGLWALVVRIYRRPAAWPLTVTPAQLGCKTWVPLDPALPTAGVQPVLPAETTAAAVTAIRQAIEVVE